MKALEPGDPRMLGGYELLGRLGSGGQGTVFLARSAADVRVAVKTLNSAAVTDPVARRRFAGEVALVRQVSSFCIAEVLDADLAGPQPYIVSEYVPGPSLQEAVAAAGPHTGGALRRLAVSTMTALAAVHAAGIVHRDFKPHNVLLGPDGPRVIDFGIARLLDATTATGHVVGTVVYMSPEQIAAGDIGPAGDMFSWAATMAYAASGRPPFGQDTIPAVMHRILNEPPDLPALPADLADIVTACLAKDPQQRPTSQTALLQLIGHAPAAPVTGQPGRPAAGRTATDPDTKNPAVRQTLPASATATLGDLRPPRRRWPLVLLATAIVGAGAVTAAVIGLAPSGAPSPSAPMSTPPRAAMTGTLLYHDDFSQHGNWDGYTFNPTGPPDQRTEHGYEINRGVFSQYVDHGYPANPSLSPVPAKHATSAEPALAFGVTAQIRRASGTGDIGLLCRWDEDNGSGYRLLLGRDGTVHAARHQAGGDLDVAPAVKSSPPATGHAVSLQALCRTDTTGTHLIFWINGKKVIDTTDSPGLPSDPISQIGLYAQVPEASQGTLYVSYDDFAVYRPT